MAHLYPSLEDKFRNEGVCPICMQEMERTPKFSCVNNHILCHRCKPYYYSCPKCYSPIDIEISPPEMNPYNPPPPVHLMPHPMSQPNAPYPTHMPMPSAPMSDDFQALERQSWYPDPPTEDQELIPCAYTRFGCWVKFPEHLRDIHESRCHFRNFEVDQSNDFHPDGEDLVDCTYKEAGCNIQIPEWRRKIHEEDCPYKGRFEALENMRDTMASVSLEGKSWREDESYKNPDEIVECRFKKYGCMVRMPFHRKRLHEEKCNYHAEDEEFEHVSYEDPDQQVDCKWTEYGCRVRPKLYRKETHEEKCNYRLDECSFKDYGCPATFHSSKRFAHERLCQYAS